MALLGHPHVKPPAFLLVIAAHSLPLEGKIRNAFQDFLARWSRDKHLLQCGILTALHLSVLEDNLIIDWTIQVWCDSSGLTICDVRFFGGQVEAVPRL